MRCLTSKRILTSPGAAFYACLETWDIGFEPKHLKDSVVRTAKTSHQNTFLIIKQYFSFLLKYSKTHS